MSIFETVNLMWTLYGTDCCHLCELADDMLTTFANAHDIVWQHVDISALEEAQMQELSSQIPVLVTDDTRLGWPFSLADLDALYKKALYKA